MSNTSKTSKLWLVFGGASILALAGAWILLAQIKPADGTAVCRVTGQTHEVTILDDKVTPLTTEAMFCDKITFTNKAKVQRLMAFGVHDKHVSYDGVSERLLAQGQSFTITLNRSGRYHFHDHHQESVEGYFNVDQTPRSE